MDLLLNSFPRRSTSFLSEPWSYKFLNFTVLYLTRTIKSLFFEAETIALDHLMVMRIFKILSAFICQIKLGQVTKVSNRDRRGIFISSCALFKIAYGCVFSEIFRLNLFFFYKRKENELFQRLIKNQNRYPLNRGKHYHHHGKEIF